MNPRDDILLSYGDTADGVVHSGQGCPQCKGGTRGERSLSVGRTGAFLWWRCHRASCGFGSKARVSGVGSDSPSSTDERRGRYREYVRRSLPAEVSTLLCERFHLTPDVLDQGGWKYTPDYDGHGPRVIMPIYGPDGMRVRGEMFRSYWGHEPKGLINAELAENVICWYRFRKYAKVCVVVEDQPSALRLAATGECDTVALLGTTLNFDRVMELREQGHRRIWLALDADATNRAVSYVQEFRNYLPSLMVKPLDCDIKDMSPEQFDLHVSEVIQA